MLLNFSWHHCTLCDRNSHTNFFHLKSLLLEWPILLNLFQSGGDMSTVFNTLLKRYRDWVKMSINILSESWLDFLLGNRLWILELFRFIFRTNSFSSFRNHSERGWRNVSIDDRVTKNGIGCESLSRLFVIKLKGFFLLINFLSFLRLMTNLSNNFSFSFTSFHWNLSLYLGPVGCHGLLDSRLNAFIY